MSAGQVADEFRRRASFDNRHQLSEKVASYVREAIMLGELQAHQFIRTERLAEDLGVSATPVREALMILRPTFNRITDGNCPQERKRALQLFDDLCG